MSTWSPHRGCSPEALTGDGKGVGWGSSPEWKQQNTKNSLFIQKINKKSQRVGKTQVSVGEEGQSWELIKLDHMKLPTLNLFWLTKMVISCVKPNNQKPSKFSQGHQEPPFHMSDASWQIFVFWILVLAYFLLSKILSKSWMTWKVCVTEVNIQKLKSNIFFFLLNKPVFHLPQSRKVTTSFNN